MSTQFEQRGRGSRGWLRRSAAGVALVLAVAACRDEPTGAVAERPGDPREGKYHVGYVLDRNGVPARVLYEVAGQDAVVEGDLVLGPASGVARTPEAALKQGAAGARFSMAITDSTDYWPGGVVPYQFKSTATTTTRNRALAAMALINGRVDGVQFVEATSTSQPYMLIQDDDNTAGSCRATLGRATPSRVNINGCGVGVAIHEIMHVLGFHHEHRRCDRDTYVTITDSLAADGSWGTRCDTGVTTVGTTYDLASIMHYDPEPGFLGWKADLWLPFEKMDASVRMGQRDTLSSCDNRALDSIYPSTGQFTCSRPYQDYAVYHTPSTFWGVERGLVVDDRDSAFSMSSTWGGVGGGSIPDWRNYHRSATDGRKAWYTFDVPADTLYKFYAWTFQADGLTPATAVFKLYSGPASTVSTATLIAQVGTVDQSTGSGWVYFGSRSLTPGTYTLQLEKQGGSSGVGRVVADAVRITKAINDP